MISNFSRSIHFNKNLINRNICHRKMSSLTKSFWKWTSQERPSWRNDFKEAVIIFTVFGMAGSTSMAIIRPALKLLIGLDGPFLDSPITYTVSTILIASPAYAITIFAIGTVAGRHIFFANMAKKVLGRFMPGIMREKLVCPIPPINSKKI